MIINIKIYYDFIIYLKLNINDIINIIKNIKDIDNNNNDNDNTDYQIKKNEFQLNLKSYKCEQELLIFKSFLIIFEKFRIIEKIETAEINYNNIKIEFLKSLNIRNDNIQNKLENENINYTDYNINITDKINKIIEDKNELNSKIEIISNNDLINDKKPYYIIFY